jgi:glycosyltransferase involved in cell wall biosynthesis
MKVAFLHFCFEDYSIELVNSLSQLVDLTLIQPEKVAAVCRPHLNPAIQVRTFSKPRTRDLRSPIAMATMMQIIREVKPDVLHVQETNDPWYDFTLLLNKMPPLVTTIHDLFRHPGDRGPVFGSEYTRRIAFYRSQQLIVHSQQMRDGLMSHFDVPAERINVLAHGELGSLYRREAPSNVQFPRDPYTLLFMGRIWPYKGLKYLVEAIPLVAETIPQVKLIIAGKGENIDQYFPSGYDPSHYEILNRFIEREDIAGLFQRSAACVLPYIEASQSGVATLAYGMGTPVIASNIGGLAEVIRHDVDGLLVPPKDVRALADAIVKLLSDRDLQQQFQAAALARCEEDLNWDRIAANTVEVYARALAKHRPEITVSDRGSLTAI